jgi:hypothetical protein
LELQQPITLSSSSFLLLDPVSPLPNITPPHEERFSPRQVICRPDSVLPKLVTR